MSERISSLLHRMHTYQVRLVLHGRSVLQFFTLLFSLANGCSQAYNTFGHVLASTWECGNTLEYGSFVNE